MSEEVREKHKVTLDKLKKDAETDEPNWDIIDKELASLDITEDSMRWAIDVGLLDGNNNIRDLAASVLNVSAEYMPLSDDDTTKVHGAMESETYNIVKYRLAIALYARGSENAAVERIMKEAMKDPGVGELARVEWAKRNSSGELE